MGIVTYPAPSASLTRFTSRLVTSGNFSVPSGVSLINVTCVGGAGGSGAIALSNASGTTLPDNGGTTTMSTISALGGIAGGSVVTNANSNGFNAFHGQNAPASSGLPGIEGQVSNLTTSLPNTSYGRGFRGGQGQVISGNLSVTPGQSIAYTIGAGGTAGSYSGGSSGNAGTSAGGYILVEWFA
jgi:hypothetical protein